MSYFVSNVVGLSLGLVVGVGVIAATGKELYVEQKKYLACCFAALVLILCGNAITSRSEVMAGLIMFVGFVVGGAGAVTSIYIETIESKVTALTVISEEEQRQPPREPPKVDPKDIDERINEILRRNKEDRS